MVKGAFWSDFEPVYFFVYCGAEFEEVPLRYDGTVPEGFEVIELPAAKYLMFQGEPFAEEDDCQAIEDVQAAIEKYDPAVTGAQ